MALADEPTVADGHVGRSGGVGGPCRNLGSAPFNSHPGSTEVATIIFRMISAGTVTPVS